MGNNGNLIFVGVSQTKSGQTRYIYYDPEHNMTLNLANPIEQYDYSNVQPISEPLKKKYQEDVYFAKKSEPTEEGYNVTFERRTNPFVEEQKQNEMFKQALLSAARKTQNPVNDVGLVTKTIPFLSSGRQNNISMGAYAGADIALQKDMKMQDEQELLSKSDEGMTNPFRGYEEYYKGRYETINLLNPKESPQVRHRAYGVGQVDTDAITNEALQNYENSQDKIVTLSGALFKKMGLENEPYHGSSERGWEKFKWAVKETGIDVAQGAIATFTFPVDAALLLAQREKFKDVSAGSIAKGLLESAKSGELEAELAGGLLVGGLVSAARSTASSGAKVGTKVAANSFDDVAKNVAGNADDAIRNLDDVVKAGAKGNLDDAMRGSADDVLESGMTRKQEAIKMLEKQGVKVEEAPGYIRLERGEDHLEIFAKGGVFEVKKSGNVDDLMGYAEWLSRFQKPVKDPTREVSKLMLNEWKGLYDPQNVRNIISEPKLRDLFGMRLGATTDQKLMLKEAGKEASKKIIYVRAPPEWEIMKRSIESAGVKDFTGFAIGAGAGAFGETNLAVQKFSDRNNRAVILPQIPESTIRGEEGTDFRGSFTWELDKRNAVVNKRVEIPIERMETMESARERGASIIKLKLPSKEAPTIEQRRMTKTATPSSTSPQLLKSPPSLPSKSFATFTGFAMVPITKSALMVPNPPPKRYNTSGFATPPHRNYSLWGAWAKKTTEFSFKVGDIDKKLKAFEKNFGGFKL